jgi:hypothetical protein
MASKAKTDLETNKAIALRLVEVFNGRRLDLLEDVLHPEFRGRGISAFPSLALNAPKRREPKKRNQAEPWNFAVIKTPIA